MSEAERVHAFWAKVDVRGLDECWPWLGGRHEAGYGRFWDGERVVPAQGYSWRLRYHGPIRPGARVFRHRCDNPPCCNPAHSYPGTYAENHADMLDKGRGVLPPITQFGERQHLAKLDDAAVVEIRREYRPGPGGANSVALARRFGVSKGAILSVVWGHTWKHVKEAPQCEAR